MNNFIFDLNFSEILLLICILYLNFSEILIQYIDIDNKKWIKKISFRSN